MPEPVFAVSADDGFNPDADSEVTSIAVQGDGKILIGGWFTAIGGTPRNYIARLNIDGSLDDTFNPDVYSANDPYVSSIAVQADGKILIGGAFTKIGGATGTTHNNIARLNSNGSPDNTFNPDADSYVFSIAVQGDGKILIGGGFTTIGGTDRNYMARLNTDGGLDTSFDPNADSPVNSIAVQGDGKILIGGLFTTIGITARNYIARLNADGSLDTSFDPNAGSTVNSLTVQADGKILVGGSFATMGGTTRNKIARLNSNGSLDSFNPNGSDLSGTINSIVVQADGKILIGGAFITIGGTTRNRIARLDANGSLDTSFDPNAGSTVNSLTVQADGKILTGGGFTTIGGTARNYIARLNTGGSLETSFDPNAGNTVNSLTVQADGKILIGGSFTSIGGTTRNRIARVNTDGSLDTLFDSNAGSTVNSLTVQADGKVLIGGSFTTIGGTTRNKIARLNSNGSLDSFNPNVSDLSGTVNSMAVQADGKILVGGLFTTFGGTTRNRIARLNADGSLDTSFDPNASGTVNSISVQADGKILIGGSFTTIGGTPRNRIARLDANGGLDTLFDPNADNTVRTIAVQADGKILIAGSFATIGGTTRNKIARLNSNGSLDSFDPNGSDLSGTINSIVVQADGKILIGGSFTTFGGATRNRIARLDANGSLDTSFDPNAGGTVNSISVQADGKIFIGGSFTSIGVIVRNRIARVTNTGAALQTFTSAIDGSSLTWMRSGTSPEVWRVTFEQSTDGTSWTPLGSGTRISGGWELTGLSLPGNQNFYVRARGYATGGYYNGSTSVIEFVKIFYLDDLTAPTTTASPAGGTYSSAQSVTLTCNDGAGSGCLTTYYCTGSGCTPTTEYTGAINISTSTVLRFYSIDNADNTESVKSETYAINTPPVANAGGPYTGSEGVSINLDGSGSSDSDGSIDTYEWDIDNNGTYDYISASSTQSHTYTQQGTYTIKLRVTDNLGATGETTTTADISDTSPVAGFTGAPTSGDSPLTVSFTNSSTGYDTPLTYGWDFDNNGTVDSTLSNPSHEYATAGTYSVKLTVTDSDGSTNSLTMLNYITVTSSCLSPVKVTGTGLYYTDVQFAYDEAGGSDSILIQDGMFTENPLLFDLNKTVTLTGGYDCNFTSSNGQTIISGNVTLSDGKITMENIRIQ